MDSLSLLSTISKYAIYFIVPILLIYITYQLFQSPLRKYPGPLLGILTDGYAGWHALQRDLHITTYKNHVKYGPIVRQAPNRLAFNTVTALYDIYLNPKVGKAHSYIYTRMKNLASVFNTLDKDDHRRRRRFIGQALSEQSMREFEPTMVSQIDVFLAQILLYSQRGEIVDMTPTCQRLAIDVVGRLAFGYPFNTQTEEPLRFIPSAMTSLNSRLNLFIQWPASHSVDPGIQFLFQKRIDRFREALRHMIQTRMELPREAKYDLYSIMATEDKINQVKQDGLRSSELWSEAGIFFTAGGSTTATAMAATFFYLSRYPDVYSKLAAEIRTTFSKSQDICLGPTLNGCHYLRAVLDEALRMSPPTPGPMWRQQDESVSNEPFIVDGQLIPPGTVVGVCLYSLMHNPEYFKDPFRFWPERWLPADDESPKDKQTRAIMRRAFAPFALGDRSCAGKAMAYAEASLTIAKAIWYFDFEICDGDLAQVGGGNGSAGDGPSQPDIYQIEDIFTAGHSGPNLRFKTRGELWKELQN